MASPAPPSMVQGEPRTDRQERQFVSRASRRAEVEERDEDRFQVDGRRGACLICDFGGYYTAMARGARAADHVDSVASARIALTPPEPLCAPRALALRQRGAPRTLGCRV
eukprot:1188622-Pleurochrysis_carterae.AAC.1